MKKEDYNSPKISEKDVYKFISEQSSLSRVQVEECFRTYSELLKMLVESDAREDGLILSLPKMGMIKFIWRKGRKKGTQYKIPADFNKDNIQVVTLEKSEPDRERLKVIFFNRFQNLLKDSSIEKQRKRQNSKELNKQFKGIDDGE